MKKYSGLDNLPTGYASDILTDACLCLEGGAFKGIYTSGVLDSLMKNNINFQTVVGVSAGALNAMNYVSGQIGRSARISLGYRHDSRYIGRKAIRKNSSVIGFDFMFNEYNQIDPFDMERFNNSKQRFIVVATDCITGKPVYFEKGKCDIYEALRASASMQYLSKMVDIEGTKCLDGSISVRVPYKWAVANEYKKLVIVRTRPRDYRKDPKESNLANHFYKDHPKLAYDLTHNHEFFNRECDDIDELEKSGRAFVLYPSGEGGVSKLERDMEKLGECYWDGYKDLEAQLPALKEFLRK